MSYIITDDKYYKDIAKSLRSKIQTDREYYPKDMAIAVDNIPSSADGTDNPVIGIYYTNPDDNGNPTKVKISGWVNPTGGFISAFTSNNVKLFIKEVEFINCNFATLADGMFSGCSSLTSINLPSSLTSIGSGAFGGCLSLTTINLPSSVKSIGQTAFSGCSSLTTINFPSSVTSIGLYTFTNCLSLKNVTLGDGFNANNLNLSVSTLYTRETILQWLNALADRTGQTAYKLTIGATNLAKLSEEDILIATNKNWTLA